MVDYRKAAGRDWHNEMRISQMARALSASRIDLSNAAAVLAALRAENFSEDCIARLSTEAVAEAGTILARQNAHADH